MNNQDEPLVHINEIAKQYPSLHGDASRPLAWKRLIMVGAVGADKVRRKLPATRIVNRWYVKSSDVVEFFRVQSIVPDDTQVEAAKPSTV